MVESKGRKINSSGGSTGSSRGEGSMYSVRFEKVGTANDNDDSLCSGIGLSNVAIMNPREDPLMNEPVKTPSPNDDNIALMCDLETMHTQKLELRRQERQRISRRCMMAWGILALAGIGMVVAYFGSQYLIRKRQEKSSANNGGIQNIDGTDSAWPDQTPSSTFDPILFGPDDGSSDSSPKFQAFKQAILDDGMTKATDLDVGANTPQRKALRWLVEYDPAMPETSSFDPLSSQYDPAMPSALDRYALTVFFFATNGPQWFSNRYWLLHPNLCSWHGVYCQQMLDENSVTRTVISSISLSNNNLKSSQIPPELFAKTTMMHLNLLSLHTNEIAGTIPTQVGFLQQMETLALFNNTLAGSLPQEIGSMKSLTNLLLSGNLFIGSIPPQIGDLTRLEQLQLYDNSMFGIIPQSISRCTRLKRLWLSKNRFSGRLPRDMFQMMTQLEALYLDENFISGPLGGETKLASATKLRDLRVYKNMFTSSVPSDLAHLTKLELIYLDQNQLDGPLPDAMLTSLPNLRELSLFKNKLTGTIPDSIGALESLEVLDLGENQFNGSLPLSLGNLRELRKLRLYKNNLLGEIPNLTRCVRLDDLELQHNAFQGYVPDWLGMLPQLKYLILTDNKFDGYLPESLGKLTQIQNFKVDQNDLLGGVPSSLCMAVRNAQEIVTDCDLECQCCTACVSSDNQVLIQGKNWNL